jgi:hypothetical protein
MRQLIKARIIRSAFLAMVMLSSCDWPVSDPANPRAIRAEAAILMNAYSPIQPSNLVTVPKAHWPDEIARLQPKEVSVHPWGVDIIVQRGFDGGWGYHVPRRDKSDLPMPAMCYSEPSKGVFWHGPC